MGGLASEKVARAAGFSELESPGGVVETKDLGERAVCPRLWSIRSRSRAADEVEPIGDRDSLHNCRFTATILADQECQWSGQL